jgi:hypothetical protein
VFVGVIEFLKEIQGVSLAFVPSLIWLQPLDRSLMARAKALNHLRAAVADEMPRFGAVAPLLPALLAASLDSPALKDRKLRPYPCACFGGWIAQPLQLVHQAIQSGPELMSNLSDAEAQVRWRKDVYKSAKRILGSLRIRLGYDDTVVSECPEVGIRLTERFDLTYCTPDLEAWAIKRMHDVYSDHERRQTKRQPFSSTSLNDPRPCPEQQT